MSEYEEDIEDEHGGNDYEEEIEYDHGKRQNKYGNSKRTPSDME